mgnify:CR=1 FL=1
MQRLFRDAHAANAHAMFSPDIQGAIFGQHALGSRRPAAARCEPPAAHDLSARQLSSERSEGPSCSPKGPSGFALGMTGCVPAGLGSSQQTGSLGGHRHAHRASYLQQARLAGAATGLAGSARAQAKPLTIGFGMALTGGLAPNGKAALLAMQICGRGHQRQRRPARPAGEARLLRRPVQSLDACPASIRSCWTSTRSTSSVSGYATNMIAPAMPIVMQKDRTFFALLGLAVNSEFNYPRYFAMHADRRTEAQGSLRRRLLRSGDGAEPQAADAGHDRRRCGIPAQRHGRRAQHRQEVLGLKIVYDKNYPPTTADYTPVVRAVAATNPDIFFACVLSARLGRHHPRLQARSASSPRSTAAAWSACRPPPSRRSSGRC